MSSHSPWFFSEESGEPFRHCIHCRLPLAEIDSPWLVTKNYRHGECVLEYAICQSCRNEISADIPEVEKAAVRSFLEREIDWDARRMEFMMESAIERRLDACIACRTPRLMTSGFGLSALFDSGGELMEGPLPLILCDRCTARMNACLSERSQASWQGFLATHFEGPPDLDDGGYPGLI
ncbi:MAG: hypothetical protein WCH40_14770 [Verrucomicrobiales bacterium]